MMQKFFICSMVFLLLVNKGYAEITITPADGVNEEAPLVFNMDENNHSFKDKTAIFIINGCTKSPTITFVDISDKFVVVLQKEDESYVVYSNQSFDYEQYQRLYSINFNGESYFETITLKINNIDDEPPSLTSPQCIMNENTVYNLKNSTCSCTLVDPDGWLNKTTFNIIPETEAAIFDIGFRKVPNDLETTAEVYICLKDGTELDYKTISSYLFLFYIIAKDSANHPTTPPEVLAIINVTPPVWAKMIAFEQFEEQQEKVLAKGVLDETKVDRMSVNVDPIDYNDEPPIFAEDE